MPPNVTVREHAAVCLDLFSQTILQLAQTESPSDQNGLLDEFVRFKLWMSNIGVFADLHSSLDYRLRDFTDIKDSFSRQLATIESRLQQLHDAAKQASSETSHEEVEEPKKISSALAFQDWDNKQLLRSIHQSIDWLHRLSNLVRKASFANQHKRADKFKLLDENDNDMSDILTDYYSKLVKREFSGMQDTLVQRLAASMLTRRRRISYRRSQQQRWKIQQAESKNKSLELSILSMESVMTLPEANSPLQKERVAVLQPKARTSAPSRLTATTVDTTIRRHVSAPSGISKGSTTPLNEQSKLLVPPPPKGAKLGEDFICDYCCLILPSTIALNSSAWANHVNKDLFPYVCVVDNCGDPIEIYSSRKEWLAHMLTRHLMRWYCTVRSHTQPLEFESEDRFTEHMKIEHPGKFRNDQLSMVAESSSRPKDPVFDDCPFCTGTSHDLEAHVALHLRDLALRSLPWPDDDERYSQQGDYLHSDSLMQSENTRETIVDLMSEPVEPGVSETLDDGDESEHDAEERLSLYGHFQEIADQYKPIDLREQLSDKTLAAFAMRKYQVSHPRLSDLIHKLHPPTSRESSFSEAAANFEEFIGIFQQVVQNASPDAGDVSEARITDYAGADRSALVPPELLDSDNYSHTDPLGDGYDEDTSSKPHHDRNVDNSITLPTDGDRSVCNEEESLETQFMTAIRNELDGEENIKVLLEEHQGSIVVTEDMVEAAAGNEACGEQVMKLLIIQPVEHVTFQERAVASIAQNFDEEMMSLLLENRGDWITVTFDLIRAASINSWVDRRVVELLLEQQAKPKSIHLGESHSPPFTGLGTLRLDALAPHNKKSGDDWHIIFNPQVQRVLDVDPVHTLVHDSIVGCVRFSPDGTQIATGSNKFARIFDVNTGKEMHALECRGSDNISPKDNYVRSLCFSPDGTYLATASEDKRLRLWEIASGTLRNRFLGHDGIYSCDFASDGRFIVSGGSDRIVRLWDIEKVTPTITMTTDDGITCVAISPDTRLIAAASMDHTVYVWDRMTGILVDRLRGPNGHQDSVYSVAFLPDGRSLVTGSLDLTAKMWELSILGGEPSKCVKTFQGHSDFIFSVTISPDALWMISVSKDRSAQFWDCRTGVAQFMLRGHMKSVISVAPSPQGGYFATGGGDMKARIWSYCPY